MFNFLIKALSEPKNNLSNLHLWKYHFLTFVDNRIFSRPTSDSFNWDHYKEHYIGELELLSQKYTTVLKEGNYSFKNNRLVKNTRDIFPLHPNWSLLYYVVLQLKPNSVLEVGCGGGMHLHNLKILREKLHVFGVDRSLDQLKFATEKFPELLESVSILDLTKHYKKLPKYDLVFSQAVLMHITSSEGAYLQALVNIFKLANKQVIFMEKWTKHPFLLDVKKLIKTGKIKWPKIYFYYYGSHPRLMICSKVKLNNYEELSDYLILTKNP